jgi:glycosyltransferase involved in cell wall biosynthesis
MRQLVIELGLEQSVIFTGFRTDVAAVLLALNVAVQPSLSENLGGTIESLLMGCPTVATRIGGMTDSILDGETGVLVSPSNPQSLALGILRILRDPIAAGKYGAAGRERMLAKFTLRRTVDDLATLYKRKFGAGRVGYRPHVIGVRLVIGSLLCLLIVLRYAVMDSYLLRRWDRG